MTHPIDTETPDPLDDLLVFNGIDADTGRYALSPMTPGRLAEHILGRPRREDFQSRASFPGNLRDFGPAQPFG